MKTEVSRPVLWGLMLLGLCVGAQGKCQAGSTLPVSNATELAQALNAAHGGEEIVLASGSYGDVSIYNKTFTDYVTLRSAEGQGAVFGALRVSTVQYMRFLNLTIDRPLAQGEPDYTRMFEIANSTHVQVLSCHIHGSIDGNYSNDGFGLTAASCFDVLVENNDIHDFLRGAVFSGTEGLTVRQNRIHHFRSDGMDFAGVFHVLIESNTVHDSFACCGDHPDFIQFWSIAPHPPDPGVPASQYVTIRGNILYEGLGTFSQALFMTSDPGIPMKDFLIEDNLIYNSHSHGITTYDAVRFTIRNNTVLTRPNTDYLSSINVYGTPDTVTVDHNVTTALSISTMGTTSSSNNLIVQWEDALLPLYYETLFLNALEGKTVTDFLPVPGSAVDFGSGLGAEARLNELPKPAANIETTTHPGTQDSLKVVLTAQPYPGGPAPAGTFQWSFGDGSHATGSSVEHAYRVGGNYGIDLSWAGGAARKTVSVRHPVLIDMPLDGSLTNDGDVPSTLGWTGSESWGSGKGGKQSAHFTSGAYYSIDVKQPDYISGMEQLRVAFDIRSEGAPAGTPVWLHTSYGFRVGDGHLDFTLWTGEATNSLTAPVPTLGDGLWHQVEGTYDAPSGVARLVYDGVLVSSRTGLSGRVGVAVGRPLTVGADSWGSQFFGWIDNFVVSQSTLALAPPDHSGSTPPETEGLNAVAYPSPYRPGEGKMTIRFLSTEETAMTVLLLDPFGAEVWRQEVSALEGNNTVLWDGRDQQGRSVAAGFYVLQLQKGSERLWRRRIGVTK